MILKKRLIILISISIFSLALVTHFSFNLTVYKFLKEAHLIRTLDMHILYFVLFSLFSMSILGIILYIFMEKFITKRIVRLSEDMKGIQGFGDLSQRLPEDPRKDEIASLILNINEMLANLEKEKISREDIEKRLITNEKLASLGRMASGIAHEINNPILAIGNCLQVIKKGSEDSADTVQEAISISESEISRLKDLLSGLLDFQRMDKGEYAPVDLKKAIQDSIKVIRWSRKLDSVEIITELEKDLVVQGSKAKIKQVLINLILNAVESFNGKGAVRIALSRDENPTMVRIDVFDNGPGIPAQIRGNFFEPFVSTKEKGMGLGLYIALNIIKNHKGEFIYDEYYGEGTHFMIKLPLQEKEESIQEKIHLS